MQQARRPDLLMILHAIMLSHFLSQSQEHSMRVILFGATGIVGQGVLRECLLGDGLESVPAIGRTSLRPFASKDH